MIIQDLTPATRSRSACGPKKENKALRERLAQRNLYSTSLEERRMEWGGAQETRHVQHRKRDMSRVVASHWLSASLRGIFLVAPDLLIVRIWNGSPGPA